MKNKKFTKQDLIDLLIKKATGFYYSEEQLEYERSSKQTSKSKSDLKTNQKDLISSNDFETKIDYQKFLESETGSNFSEIDVARNGVDENWSGNRSRANKNLQILENQLSIFDENGAFDGKNAIRQKTYNLETQKNGENEPKNGFKVKNTAIRAKTESKIINCLDTVSSEYGVLGAKMDVSNDAPLCENSLQIAKKKVTTHFVAPDMIAIKILFEIFEKKVDEDDLEKITDDELINLKKKLLEELKNDDD